MIPLMKVFMPAGVGEKVKEVLYSGYVGQGKYVEDFERIFGEYIGNPNVLALNSCTSALKLALRLAGVEYGDKVLTVSMTCLATNTPIEELGAIPIWTEINPKTGVIDTEKLPETDVKAVIAVDLGGYPCNYDKLTAYAKSKGIKLIVDAAHSLGAEYRGENVGKQADFMCFSLQAVKVINTVDGGFLACRSKKDLERGRLLRWYGLDRRKQGRDMRHLDDIQEAGYKMNMNNLNAVIGIEQIKFIDVLLESVRRNAGFYDKYLPFVQKMEYEQSRRSSYWLYPILVENRRKFTEYMFKNGVMVSQVHRPNHKYTAFRGAYKPLPITDAFFEKLVCIPVGWWVSHGDRERIVNLTGGFYEKTKHFHYCEERGRVHRVFDNVSSGCRG